MTIFTYIIGIVLIVQLFNLQIIHGAEYREQSNTRLTRESTLKADRGDILDRYGNSLVSSSQKFNLELYKSKIDTQALNNSILKIVNVLEKYNITQALISEEYADLVCKSGHSVKCQFAIDTGMNRVGLDGDFPEECIRIIRKYSSQLELDGLFTHLCVADSSIKKHVDFTKMQIDKFEIIANRLSDLKLPNIHCLNSAAGLWHKSKYNDIIRLGIILYGLKPDYMNKLPEGIIPIMAWKSVIAMVKTVKKGDTIGYGCSFKAKKDMKIATIPTGYADGYSRSLSNKGHVYINGCKANIVGKICMDQFMVDVTDVPDVNINEEVSLLGNLHNADDMAADIGTIGYEIVCSISKRVPRVYKIKRWIVWKMRKYV